MWTHFKAFIFIFLLGTGSVCADPLSVIDWLNEQIKDPIAAEEPNFNPDFKRREAISVRVLGQPRLDDLGILSAHQLGLPSGLWDDGEMDQVLAAINAVPVDLLPSLQELFSRILISEQKAPHKISYEGELLLARAEALLARGFLIQAAALLGESDKNTPALFRRWFDVSLLLGKEDSACKLIQDTPHIAPTPAAQIFCLARLGDWSSAALLLQSHAALGLLPENEINLLRQFLDPELAEDEGKISALPQITPLNFTMLSAIGEAPPTRGLPVVFAHKDLGLVAGWKARISAAERLAVKTALPVEKLAATYREHKPVSAGGVWRRATTLQRVEKQLGYGTIGDGSLLEEAWLAFSEAGLAHALAAHLGPVLRDIGAIQNPIAMRLILLSDPVSPGPFSCDILDRNLAVSCELAWKQAAESVKDSSLITAILRGFSAEIEPQIKADGLVLLQAIRIIGDGRGVDPRQLTKALQQLRQAGLEEMALQVGVELLLLPIDR